MKVNYLHRISILIFACLIMTSCKFYSFTGADIPAGAKTVAVYFFENKATNVAPTLSQAFTDALREKFIRETSLNLVREQGDLEFEGYISNYRITPVAPRPGETAALSRLTITITVSYRNTIEENKGFENTTFSQFEDYDSSQDISQVEETLIEAINEKLTQDIFNRSVVNW